MSEPEIVEGDAVALLRELDARPDLLVTRPPYYLSTTAGAARVVVVLREAVRKVRHGAPIVVLTPSSWRAVAVIVEAVRGLAEPRRFGAWCMPTSHARSSLRASGWQHALVIACVFKRGSEGLPYAESSLALDHVLGDTWGKGQVPDSVARWAVEPHAAGAEFMLDPFAGGCDAFVRAAAALGLRALGIRDTATATTETPCGEGEG